MPANVVSMKLFIAFPGVRYRCLGRTQETHRATQVQNSGDKNSVSLLPWPCLSSCSENHRKRRKQPPSWLCIWEPWLRLPFDWQGVRNTFELPLVPRGCVRSSSEGQKTRWGHRQPQDLTRFTFYSRADHLSTSYHHEILFRALN